MVQAFYLSRISLNAELLQIYENLKIFLSVLSFEAGFMSELPYKLPKYAKCQTKLC